MLLGSFVCAELLSEIEGTDFHFKFGAAHRTLTLTSVSFGLST